LVVVSMKEMPLMSATLTAKAEKANAAVAKARVCPSVSQLRIHGWSTY
jgi:hypothetical protein